MSESIIVLDTDRVPTEDAVVFPEGVFPGVYRSGVGMRPADLGMTVTEARERIKELNLPLKISTSAEVYENEAAAASASLAPGSLLAPPPMGAPDATAEPQTAVAPGTDVPGDSDGGEGGEG